MSHQVTLRIDEDLLRRAVLRFWWRVVGIRFVIAMVVMAVGLVVLVSGGDRSWFVGVLATVLALGVAFVVAIYVVHLSARSRCRRRGGQADSRRRAGDLCRVGAQP
jgi:membrane protein YdbS with pleckstrin-like domain